LRIPRRKIDRSESEDTRPPALFELVSCGTPLLVIMVWGNGEGEGKGVTEGRESLELRNKRKERSENGLPSFVQASFKAMIPQEAWASSSICGNPRDERPSR